MTPEKKSRSRPPSYAGGGGTGSGDSPVTLRSRSSTCDSLQSGSSPSASTNRQQMPPPPPPQARKPVAGKHICLILFAQQMFLLFAFDQLINVCDAVPTPMAPDISMNIHGSLKKRIAPPPPPPGNASSGVVLPSSHYGTLPMSATSTHSRTTSEPILAGHTLHTLPHSLNILNSQHHKRSPSGDSSTGHGTFDRIKISQEERFSIFWSLYQWDVFFFCEQVWRRQILQRYRDHEIHRHPHHPVLRLDWATVVAASPWAQCARITVWVILFRHRER